MAKQENISSLDALQTIYADPDTWNMGPDHMKAGEQDASHVDIVELQSQVAQTFQTLEELRADTTIKMARHARGSDSKNPAEEGPLGSEAGYRQHHFNSLELILNQSEAALLASVAELDHVQGCQVNMQAENAVLRSLNNLGSAKMLILKVLTKQASEDSRLAIQELARGLALVRREVAQAGQDMGIDENNALRSELVDLRAQLNRLHAVLQQKLLNPEEGSEIPTRIQSGTLGLQYDGATLSRELGCALIIH